MCNCSYFGNPRALAALLCDRLRDSEHIVVVSGTVPGTNQRYVSDMAGVGATR